MKLAFKAIIGNDIGDNKAKDFLTYCKNKEWIKQKTPKGIYKQGKFNESV